MALETGNQVLEYNFDSALTDTQRIVKRVLDLIIGGFCLLALIPLMSLVALAIKLESKGPVLYHQKRVGEAGQLFTIYKFRSMIDGADKLYGEVLSADKNGNVIYKQKYDSRITRVGRIIRRTSLDEIPQLINVLEGTMSLVGPRPELPIIVRNYQEWQYERFSVPAGMTGLWQINGRAEKPMHLNTKDDIYYIKNYSLWMDLIILLKTPWAVIRGHGAY